MSKLTQTTLASMVVLLLVFFLGRLFFLSPIEKKLKTISYELKQTRDNQKMLDQELAKLKSQGAPPEKSGKKRLSMLKPGNESDILQIVHNSTRKTMKIKSFETIKSFFVKPSEEDSYSTPVSTGFQPGQELPELDENGLPIGAMTEEETEWAGVEILPVKITFNTTFRGLGSFLSESFKKLPIHSVRSLDLVNKKSGIVRGTIILNFPLKEN